ncbi:hypothetical protein EZV73_17570 [Acidaminobacter sp. JC074]|uniref:putative quinol monooxygenase n=1 Tax=Acidaminobacter sp. JC074 TaxID=2530199 RepID=UPI001F0F8209|nr:antibiotic biosynthesis monooxygenase [Acidaminobacter sp. JC074]MCH4889412.1 hypothetical protein [Acidaminobacter sp. JC074]
MYSIITTYKIKDEYLIDFIELFEEVSKGIVKENGCVRFELYQDTSDRSKLTTVEEWENDLLYKEHLDTEFIYYLSEQVKRMTVDSHDKQYLWKKFCNSQNISNLA